VLLGHIRVGEIPKLVLDSMTSVNLIGSRLGARGCLFTVDLLEPYSLGCVIRYQVILVSRQAVEFSLHLA